MGCDSAEDAMHGIGAFVAGTFISFLLSWHILPMLQDSYAKYNITQSGANWKNGLKMMINRMTCGCFFRDSHSPEKRDLTWVSSTIEGKTAAANTVAVTTD